VDGVNGICIDSPGFGVCSRCEIGLVSKGGTIKDRAGPLDLCDGGDGKDFGGAVVDGVIFSERLGCPSLSGEKGGVDVEAENR